MKQCPQCRKIYADDELNFCLDDGAVLVTANSRTEEETVVLPPRMQPQPARPRRGLGSILAFIAVGLVALVAGGAIVAWVLTRPKTPERVDANTNASRQQENRPADTPRPSPTNSPSPTATPEQVDPAVVRREVESSLNGWVRALTEKDLDGRMEFYADRLDTYYTKRNVAASSVRGENVRVFDRYSELEMDISNLDVSIDKDSGQVVTTFDKTFNFLGDEKDFSGSVRSEFRWKKINGRWRIVSERDLKVY